MKLVLSMFKRAFEDLKDAITTAPVLIPYKPGRETGYM